MIRRRDDDGEILVLRLLVDSPQEVESCHVGQFVSRYQEIDGVLREDVEYLLPLEDTDDVDFLAEVELQLLAVCRIAISDQEFHLFSLYVIHEWYSSGKGLRNIIGRSYEKQMRLVSCSLIILLYHEMKKRDKGGASFFGKIFIEGAYTGKMIK